MSPLRNPVQGLLGRLGTVFLGILFFTLVAWEFQFSRNAKHGEAVIASSYLTSRSGPSVAKLKHRVDGRDIDAEIVAFYWHPAKDEVIPIAFLPSDPARPSIDTFGRRYAYLIITGSFFLIIAIAEAVARRSKRRSDSLERRFESQNLVEVERFPIA